ncbi:hypothetical protein LPTSP3_g10630 [Leptospira kobayashii]|uniref:histidine kinase n=1 Tax=Leptospira kobayashii TaxID=1917830 RepID=A0ABN6KAW2_9LEPT|nr:histidine kinase dimerization/phosphoacceptor domain -containing protein [Leptospira kobayashii]BDA78133.1 hypothetical protein LPTSP3_g10630 [Leptospira kobayashii]
MKPAIRVSLIYFVLGFVWIYLSDYALASFLNESEDLRIAQSYKGWLFVTLSSLLIFFLLLSEFKVQFKFQKEKEDSDHLYRNILEQIQDSVIVFNLNTWKIELISKQTANFYETSVAAIVDNPYLLIERLHPEDKERMVDMWTNRLRENHSSILYRLLFPDGRVKWALENRLFYDSGSEMQNRAIALTTDITDYMQNQEKLEKSLKENEVLLTEVHHRVKNNLAVIISFLQLQSYSAPPDAAAILDQSIARIRAIALVHEKLYSSKNLSGLNSKMYIESLVENIKLMYMRMDIRIHLNIEPRELDLTSAIPLGLMLTELLTNSFRHAFPNPQEAVISVDFRINENDKIELIYKDNGVGLPSSFDRKRIDTVGLSVIFSLSSQMMGREIEVLSKPGEGVLFHFEFPNYKDKKGIS